MNTDLKKIKKYYGEKMMQFCRKTFPTILEYDGELYDVINTHFAHNKFLYEDLSRAQKLNSFTDYVRGYFMTGHNSEIESEPVKNPFELMSEAGYDLYHCNSESDVRSFIKYYAEGERLCTFNENRLRRCLVFFAVKKNVDQITRSAKPAREDEYGTSVISIQFTRGKNNILSIKNRYNHHVNNPDATFSNNLELIIPGLTQSFAKYFSLNISRKYNYGELSFSLPDYVAGPDGKYYRYNCKEGNTYYCQDNYIIKDNKLITKYHHDAGRYIIFESYIMDIKEKTVSSLEGEVDEFSRHISTFDDVIINKSKDDKELIIKRNGFEDVHIHINSRGQIIKYFDPNILEIKNKYLVKALAIRDIDLPNCEVIGNNFMSNNPVVDSVNLPKVKDIGHEFLHRCYYADNINLDSVRYIGDSFMEDLSRYDSLDLPNVLSVGTKFLANCDRIKSLSMPKCVSIDSYCLVNNKTIGILNVPSLKYAENSFLYTNKKIGSLIIDSIESMGYLSLDFNPKAYEQVQKTIALNLESDQKGR